MIPATAGVPYSVPPEPSRWSSLLLAALVHAGLLGFLAIGVNWQSEEPPSIEAEIWDVQTEMAAPPAPPQPEPVPQPEPEPTPPPRVEEPVQPAPPDIALEREKQRKLKEQEEKAQRIAEEKAKKQKEKEEKEKLAKLEKERKAEQARLDKIRQENLARMTAELGGAGTAAQSRAPKSDPGYIASLTAKIKSNIIYAGSRDVEGNPHAIYRIEQLPTGEVISYKKIRSSGIPEYDRAVEQAIMASSPLPKKKDGTVERSIEPIFRLKD